MGRYDKERPWHSWADLRVQVRLLPWHWRLLPDFYRDAGNLSTFEWLFLRIEYWTWDRVPAAVPSGKGIPVHHQVCCKTCGLVPNIVTFDGDTVPILPIEGWSFTTDAGWLCPDHAPASTGATDG